MAILLLPALCCAYSATDMDYAIRSAMQDSKLTGVALAVFKDDKVIFSKGYGYANVERSKPMSGDSVFRVASLSKMVTAAAIMKLYERGLLNLTEDVSVYLGYPLRNPMYPYEKITARQLLLHTSSLKDSGCYDSLINSNARLFRSMDLAELLVPGGRYYQKSLFAQSAPGEAFNYSNLGYGILGAIVEKVSGMRFDKYCRDQILLPLGMDAGFDAADIRNWQNIGVTYRYSYGSRYAVLDDAGSGKPTPLQITAPPGNPVGWSPTGGLRVSANDMAKFMMMLANGGSYNGVKILSKECCDYMCQLQWQGVGYDGLDEQVGLFRQEGFGLNVVDQLCDGWRLTGHSGDAYGLISGAYYDNLSKLGFVYIINGGIYKTAQPQSPNYIPERSIADALHNRYDELLYRKALEIELTSGAATASVNGRRIVLPSGCAVDADGYVPLITLSDLLGLAVDSGERDSWFLTRRDMSVKIALKDTTLNTNGYLNTYLPKAPYSKSGVIYVPLRAIADALKIDYVIKTPAITTDNKTDAADAKTGK